MSTLLVGLIVGFGVGGSLGLLGSGGSVLTVPALVYLIGQNPQTAVATSLAIVGTNSAMGMLLHRAQGTLNWRVAVVFGGAGMLVSFFAANLSKNVPPTILMMAFATLLLLVGFLLVRQKTPRSHAAQIEQVVLWKILVGGMGMGLLTGILGVGGGFLIVPALVMLIGMPMHHAVGTSLAVIAMNSFAGFLGHMADATLDLPLIAVFIAAGIAGTFAGTRLNKRVDACLLGKIFGVFLMALAVFLLYDNLSKMW